MKKIIAILLVLITMMCAAVPAFAEQTEAVQPRYKYVEHVSANLMINTQTDVATCTSSFSAGDSSRLRLVMYLQLAQGTRWETVMTWETTGTDYVSLNRTRSITASGTYRTYAVGYVLDANGVILEVATAEYRLNA